MKTIISYKNKEGKKVAVECNTPDGATLNISFENNSLYLSANVEYDFQIDVHPITIQKNKK